ncbi:MAG: type transport system ATP-binding protein, partial [Mycobacteriales bacterium]
GGTVLLSSHLLSEVEHTVDRLLVIGGGRVVADAPIAELLASDDVFVAARDLPALANDLQAAGHHTTAQPVAGRRPVLRVSGATAEQIGALAADRGHVLTELRPADHRLEDLFFELTTAA